MNNFTKFEPPEGTELTVIHDIYGEAILVYFPMGDKESPRNCEEGIRQAQLEGGGRGRNKQTNIR